MVANRFPRGLGPVRCGVVVGAVIAMWMATANTRSQNSETTVLSKVPADAIGFVHFKVGQIWKAEVLAGLREIALKAGPKAAAALDKRFSPRLSSMDSACFFVTPMDEERPPIPAALLHFSESFEPNKTLKALLPEGRTMNHFGQKYQEDRKADIAIKAVDEKTLLITSAQFMPKLLSRELNDNGAMKAHLAAAVDQSIYAVIDAASLPREAMEQLPESLQPLLAAKEVVLTGALDRELALTLKARYADEESAKMADATARRALGQARKELGNQLRDLEDKVLTPPKPAPAPLKDLPEALTNFVGLAMVKSMDEYLANPPIKLVGDSLLVEQKIDLAHPSTITYSAGMMAGLLVPATQKVRAAASRVQGQNNLKHLALAMFTYEAIHRKMPYAVYSKDGKKALLSWRVAILPYIDQESLYRQFKLDEPWNSEHNKKLIAKMPSVFQDPDATPAGDSGKTHYQVFVGGGAGFQPSAKGTALSEIYDGTSNTIMIAVANDPVTWTKPEDIVYDPNKPFPKLGLAGKPVSVAFFDGSVRALPAKISDRNLRAFITRAGGELVSDD